MEPFGVWPGIHAPRIPCGEAIEGEDMRCLAEFTLDSDLRLPDDAAPVEFVFPDGSVLTLRNRGEGLARPNEVLTGFLEFDANDLTDGSDVAEEKMVAAMNSLSFTTNRAFRLRRFCRIADWTPGLKERQVVVMQSLPEWEVAEPRLDQAFVQSASRILAMQDGETVQAAMRWYRLGLLADTTEDQFSNIWFAVEIVAEALKDQHKVTTKCPKCQAPLYCETCAERPLHRKFATDAIRSLIELAAPKGANTDEIFQALQKIRNTLLHGRPMESIRDKLPCTEDQALNVLGKIAWRGISHLANQDADPLAKQDVALIFGDVPDIRRRSLRVSLVGSFTPNATDNLTYEDLPTIKISTLYDGQELPPAK